MAPSVGGTLTFSVTPAFQIVGEAGRLGNVLPTMSDAAVSAADLGMRVSALYGEGGARLVMAPGSPVTPYVEGTAGVARLGVSTDRFGPVANAAATLALQFIDRTTPTVGGGAGILLRGGPIMFDVGYRYKHLFADDLLRIGLGFGQPFHSTRRASGSVSGSELRLPAATVGLDFSSHGGAHSPPLRVSRRAGSGSFAERNQRTPGCPGTYPHRCG